MILYDLQNKLHASILHRARGVVLSVFFPAGGGNQYRSGSHTVKAAVIAHPELGHAVSGNVPLHGFGKGRIYAFRGVRVTREKTDFSIPHQYLPLGYG